MTVEEYINHVGRVLIGKCGWDVYSVRYTYAKYDHKPGVFLDSVQIKVKAIEKNQAIPLARVLFSAGLKAVDKDRSAIVIDFMHDYNDIQTVTLYPNGWHKFKEILTMSDDELTLLFELETDRNIELTKISEVGSHKEQIKQRNLEEDRKRRNRN